MDMILGLPGETESDNLDTVDQIMRMLPDNITLHTLAVKRGSRLAELERYSETPPRAIEKEESSDQAEKAMNTLSRILAQADYLPYYLYRQKYMRADTENVGWAKPGSFCLYNINMIEERQSILGLGGGAASKFVGLDGGSLDASYNPKNPTAYVQSVESLIARKVDKLAGLKYN
jgi:oxygen-independent coproporphyrinogen-3 oxidase